MRYLLRAVLGMALLLGVPGLQAQEEGGPSAEQIAAELAKPASSPSGFFSGWREVSMRPSSGSTTPLPEASRRKPG